MTQKQSEEVFLTEDDIQENTDSMEEKLDLVLNTNTPDMADEALEDLKEEQRRHCRDAFEAVRSWHE
jgi:hypothetical protein